MNGIAEGTTPNTTAASVPASPRSPATFRPRWRLVAALAPGHPVLAMRLVALAFVGGLCGCATPAKPPTPAPGDEATALYETDRRFSQTADMLGVAEAFRQFVAERAVKLPNGELPIEGRQAIYDHLRQVGDAHLEWAPVAAEVARSGELGYTWGFYEVRAHEPGGRLVTGYGKYTTIWQKQPDGAWKVILDIGNPGPRPPAPR
jgi:ketosteroid isomerase-like protein